MANVNIKFNNKDYLLSCDDGQEESLKKLTKFLDKKYSELQDKLGNIGENKLLLITTIQLIDEYFNLKQKVTDQKAKLDVISNRFKEIKTLAIKYKDDKDIRIGIPMIGSGYGKGNWKDIATKINEATPDIDITLVRWERNK